MNRMHDKKKKYMFFSAFFLSLFGMTVVYAALSTNLSIGGTIDRHGGNWNIYFSNVSASSNSTSAVSHSAKISEINPTSLSISCSFVEGGGTSNNYYDEITYIITVKNDSDFDAKLSSWNLGDIVTGSEMHIYGVEGWLRYADQRELSVGDILPKGSSVDLELELLTWKDNGVDIDEDKFFNFNVSVEYVQA